ncbi:MAG: imidazole glycerol-phosphate synthase subunit HisH [Thermoplasmata archaeon]|jgi:glutamine amidotransferase|nr:imidazole glycerol-phosphate synthase subunit HisH [Thermoplasmata archaeon]
MTWALFDYGVGNLHSLRKALEAAGAETRTTTEPADLASATVAVLPGVGAFGAVMASLEGVRGVLGDRHRDGRPILGICIGSQVLHDASSESLGVRGLGLVPGAVERIPASAGKVPHMGWNQLDPARDPLFEGFDGRPYAYFVHSYAAPVLPETVATTTYGMVFSAAVRSGNTVGVQFHPEKSSSVGARILKNAVSSLEAAA